MILMKWKDRQKNTIKLHLDKIKQHKYMAETSRKASECYCIKKSTMSTYQWRQSIPETINTILNE